MHSEIHLERDLAEERFRSSSMIGRREKPIVSARRAAEMVSSNCTITTGGFGSCGHPDLLTEALAQRFSDSGLPTGLTLIFAAGQGDKKDRGLNKLATAGLLKKVIGGYWALTPSLGKLAMRGAVEAHNWPQGVISHLFRAIAGGKPGVVTDVGLHTFIDPRLEGGRVGPGTTEELIGVLEIANREYLFYPSLPIDVAFLRGTRADIYGNVTMEEEANFQDSLAQAQAARNSGGIVIVQVLEIVKENTLRPHEVRIPGIFVDYLVQAEEHSHWQTYGERFNTAYTGHSHANAAIVPPLELDAKKIIARRAFLELAKQEFPIVNLGIGTPEYIAKVAAEESDFPHVLTIESGVIGGTPAGGLSFGASSNPQAILDQAAQFDFYDGGGIDIAFLGFAQIDSKGNVNISRFGEKLNGVGGFVNISQNAKRVVFCGTFTAKGLDVQIRDGKVCIIQEGAAFKFIEVVEQLSFNAPFAEMRNREVIFITERAVIALEKGQLVLKEVAPGIDIERDIVRQSSAKIVIPEVVNSMPARVFCPASMSSSDAFFGYSN